MDWLVQQYIKSETADALGEDEAKKKHSSYYQKQLIKQDEENAEKLTKTREKRAGEKAQRAIERDRIRSKYNLPAVNEPEKSNPLSLRKKASKTLHSTTATTPNSTTTTMDSAALTHSTTNMTGTVSSAAPLPPSNSNPVISKHPPGQPSPMTYQQVGDYNKKADKQNSNYEQVVSYKKTSLSRKFSRK